MSRASERVCGSIDNVTAVLRSTLDVMAELSNHVEPGKVALLVPQESCIQIVGRHKTLWYVYVTLTGLLVPGGGGLVQWSCTVVHLGAGSFSTTRYDGTITGIIEETMAQLSKK